MRHTFSHRVKVRLAAVLLLCLVPACAGSHTLRLSVPVSEAATVGRLTQPVRRPETERRLIAGGPRPVQVGEITRVRVIGPRPAPAPVALPFFAEVRQAHLVVSDRTGRLSAFPLDSVQRLEVDSTMSGSVWRPADYVLLAVITLFSTLTLGLYITAATDD